MIDSLLPERCVYYGNLDNADEDNHILSFEKAAKCGYAVTDVKWVIESIKFNVIESLKSDFRSKIIRY